MERIEKKKELKNKVEHLEGFGPQKMFFDTKKIPSPIS